jgi:hypothetical protein
MKLSIDLELDLDSELRGIDLTLKKTMYKLEH